MRRLLLAAALVLTGCVTTQPRENPRAPAIAASADATAALLDAIGQAPPATLTKTVIDDKAVRLAFQAADKALDVIDALIDAGVIRPGSPTALRIRAGVLTTMEALNAASAAQRAGSATTYREALTRAREAMDSVQLALAQ